MLFFVLLFACILATVLLQSLVFLRAKSLQRIDLIDGYWGLSLVLAVATAYIAAPEKSLNLTIALLLIGIWGFRLSTHVLLRFSKTKTQDKRYTELVQKWSKFSWARVYKRIFVVQALLAVAIATPVIFTASSGLQTPLPILVAGIAIWLVGFLFEVIADAQLRKFKQSGKSGLLTTGLWRYSRHPNYFGEITLWWGVWVMSLHSPLAVLTVVGPLTITYLITRVSGVPPSERQLQNKKGWKTYKAKTSKLIPRF